MRITFVDPTTETIIQELVDGESMKLLNYVILGADEGAKLTIERDLMPAPHLLEQIALKWIKKNVHCHIYMGDILYKSLEVLIDQYQIQTDPTGCINEVLFSRVVSQL